MRKSVKVTFADNNAIYTDINGTDAEILEYYKVGGFFNLGGYINPCEDNMQAVVKCEFLQEIENNYKQYNTDDFYLKNDLVKNEFRAIHKPTNKIFLRITNNN